MPVKHSDTPRTDAMQEHVSDVHNDQVCTVPTPDPYVVPAEFARRLEREPRELLAEVERFRGAKVEINGLELKLMTAWADTVQLKLDGEKLRQELSSLRLKVKAAEGMAEALEQAGNGLKWFVANHPTDESSVDEAMRDKIESALALWQEANK